MEVYLDLVMLMNFIVDLLLLLGTYRLSGHPPEYRKAVIAAAVGGLYAGACLLPGFIFLGKFPLRVIFLSLIAVIAFGWKGDGLRSGALFIFLSIALGGVVLMMGREGILSVLVSGTILSLLCILAARDKVSKAEYVAVMIRHKQRVLRLRALLDTGNTLKDPITGNPVLVADANAAYQLLGLQEDELHHPIETISRGKYPGLRLIPYCAIGQPAGMLLGLKTEELWINGKPSCQIVAFAPQRIGQGSGFEALTGGNT